MELRDPEIRKQLKEGLARRMAGNKHTLVVDELGLIGGVVRADVSVISPDEFVGYEIKSDFDSLVRLKRQVEVYDLIYDRSFLICGNKYISKALQVIPEHWGLTTLTAVRVLTGSEVDRYAYKLKFHQVRAAVGHEHFADEARVQLLWADEMLSELRLRNLARGLKGRSRAVLGERLVEQLSSEQLREVIARRLSQRTSWREPIQAP